MAKFGKIPVLIPEQVQVEIKPKMVKITGPKGSLGRDIPREIEIKQEKENLLVECLDQSKKTQALQGTTRAHLANMIKGVVEGWEKKLEMAGAGYRAEVKGQDLILTLGFSHPVTITAPEGVGFQVEKNVITVQGIDIEKVTQTAAKIRAARKPDPYKEKGIKYVGEVIRRKAGKQAVKTEGV